jgi:hypothetical protein
LDPERWIIKVRKITKVLSRAGEEVKPQWETVPISHSFLWVQILGLLLRINPPITENYSKEPEVTMQVMEGEHRKRPQALLSKPYMSTDPKEALAAVQREHQWYK